MLLFGFASVSLLSVSCSNKNSSDSNISDESASSNYTVTLTDDQIKNANITIGKAEEREMASLLKLYGKIEVPPQNLISVSVPLGGYLEHTNLLPGMPVKKGDVLAIVEDIQYIELQRDYLAAQTRLKLLDSDYKRQQKLNETKSVSDKQFEEATAEYQAQRILLKSMEQKLKLIGLQPESLTAENISKSIKIVSPINGYVSAVKANIGKYITPGEVLFELINPDDMHLALTVFDKDVPSLSIGQKVIAYTNAQPNNKYPCEIILITKNVYDNNTAQVHCHFEKYDHSLLPGMYMNAEVEINARKNVVLPESAVVRFDGKHYVFVQESNNQFTMTEVSIVGKEGNDVAVISSHALLDKSVVINGAYYLLMSLKNKADE